jgi:hypothetical protein
MHKTSPSFDLPVRSQLREHLPLVLIELFALIAGAFAEPSAHTLALLIALLCVRHGLLACVATYRSMQARRATRVSVEVRLAERPKPEQREHGVTAGGGLVGPMAPLVDQKTSPYDCHGIAQAVEAVIATKNNIDPNPTKLTE